MISLIINTNKELDELKSVIDDTKNHFENISIYKIQTDRIIFTNTEPIKLLNGYHVHQYYSICHQNDKDCPFYKKDICNDVCCKIYNPLTICDSEIDVGKLRIHYDNFDLSDYIDVDNDGNDFPTDRLVLNLKIDFTRDLSTFSFENIYIE